MSDKHQGRAPAQDTTFGPLRATAALAALTAFLYAMWEMWTALDAAHAATFVRAPDDKPCASSMPFKSWIKPEQDEAEAKVAAMFPDLVVQRPKFEVKSCADFGGNPPHYSGAGATATAKMLGEYYKNLQ